MNDEPLAFDDRCHVLRNQIKAIGAKVRALHDHSKTLGSLTQAEIIQAEDIGANIELAYRHLEDAAMGLGKSIQAWDGGISVYDKE
jgi:hypothetical protein